MTLTQKDLENFFDEAKKNIAENEFDNLLTEFEAILKANKAFNMRYRYTKLIFYAFSFHNNEKTYKFIAMLLRNGADPNYDDSDLFSRRVLSPLHHAASAGDFKTVTLLLEKNAKADCVNHENITPLHLAAEKGHCEIAELLLNHNAKINCVDKDGTSPLQKAAQNNHSSMIDLLLKKGANINHRNNNGRTALSIATTSHYPDFLLSALLKEDGQSIDSRCHNIDRLPSEKQIEVITLLALTFNADVMIADNNHFTSVSLAVRICSAVIFEVLTKKNENANITSQDVFALEVLTNTEIHPQSEESLTNTRRGTAEIRRANMMLTTVCGFYKVNNISDLRIKAEEIQNKKIL